jgi:hypothetical protein
MRLAVAVGLLLGLFAPLIAVGLVSLGFARCIDSPQFLNPRPLAWAGGGVGLMTAGAILLGSAKHPRLGVTVLAFGTLFIAYALAGPPYNSCREWEGFLRG